MMARRWTGGVAWLVAYVAVMGAVVWMVLAARQRVLSQMNTPQAQAEWETWRQTVRDQADSGPVHRRVPKSSEPPAVVLLRDYFGTCLTAAVLFSSLLFGVIAFLLQGALRSGGQG